ncbi:MAG: hypothetical protein ACOH2F_03675 [Cellulomonas sp.]
MTQIQTRQTGAQRKAQTRRSVQVGKSSPVRQVKRLFVVRESTAYAWELFGAMMLQVLERHQALPSVATVLAHGVTLVHPGPAGEQLRAEFNAVPIRRMRHGRGRQSRALGYLFIIGEDAFLLSQMSASRADEDGAIAFGSVLAPLILELRPEELHTGPASRFGRSTEVFARVANAVKEVGCRVFSDEAPEGLDLTQPNDAMRWDFYGLIAAAEVREILKRLTIGRLLDARSGRWPMGRRHVVMGYSCGADKMPKVSRDTRVVAWVRALIEMGADAELTLDDIVERLSAMGLTTPKLQEIYGRCLVDGEADDFGELTDGRSELLSAVRPREVVDRLYGHLETYLTGDYRFDLTCPVAGVTEWCSTPVAREAGDQFGAFHLKIPMGVPDGGWAAEDVLRRAIKLRCGAGRSPRPTGGAAHLEDHKPFAGFVPWRCEGEELVLSAKFPSYHLLTRDKGFAGHGWHDGAGPGTLVAAVNAGAFHQNFADRVLRVLDSEGFDLASIVYASRPVSALVATRPDVEQWSSQVRKLRTTVTGLAQSVGLARGNGDEPTAQLFEEALSTTTAQIAKFEKLIAAEPAVGEPTPPAQANVAGLPELLKLLQLGLVQYAPIVSNRLHRLVYALRFEATPFNVNWSCELRLPTDAGIVHIPVSGRVANCRRARGSEKVEVERARTAYLVKLWIEEGLDIPAIAERVGWSDPDSVERRLRRSVVDLWPVTPAMRHALIDCPFPAVRRVIARFVAGDRGATPWERLVVETYTGVTSWQQSWAADDVGDRQRVVDLLRLAGASDPDVLERGLPLTLLAEASGVHERRISETMAGEPNSRGGRLRAPLYGRVLEKRSPGASPCDGSIRLRCCPWCRTRTVTIVRRAPELGVSPILCSTCMRRPDDAEGVEFPEEYRTVSMLREPY